MASARDPELVLDDGEVTVPVVGEFEMATTFTVEPALERAMDLPGLRRLTLDLSDVTFLDSTGLGVVLRLASDLPGRGVELRIVPGPPEVQRVFETAGLADALPFAREA
jgi:anti-anti-sigma factor